MKFTLRLWKGGPGSGHRGHAGRPGSVGGSVPGAGTVTEKYFQGEGGKHFSARGTNNYQREQMLGVMMEAGITPENLEGLILTTVPSSSDYKLRMDMEYYEKISGGGASGYYRNVGARGRAHIHPAQLESTTLIHEIGHHVHLRMPLARRMGFQNWAGSLMESVSDYMSKAEIAKDLGLRGYSFTSPREFIADCFVTYKFGTSSQKINLTNLWQDTPWDLDEIFKEVSWLM